MNAVSCYKLLLIYLIFYLFTFLCVFGGNTVIGFHGFGLLMETAISHRNY